MKTNYGKMCPDPAFERKDYEFLTGEWKFSFSPDGTEPVFDKKIVVPYSYECDGSGIGDRTMHECVWYEREFCVKPHGGRVLLRFEGVDYFCAVFINGVAVGEHRGGYTPFCLDITDRVAVGSNTVRVKVRDDFNGAQLRGKQRRRAESYDCWYVQTTGIWKPVWLEYAGSVPLEKVSFLAKNDGTVTFEGRTAADADVTVAVSFGGKPVAEALCRAENGAFGGRFRIDDPALWSDKDPALYSVTVSVGGAVKDEVHTYFAFREITSDERGIYVNGERVYLAMILAQGYWKETGLTAPDESALEEDVRLIRELGFNGIRMHQKVESNVFYYLCDKLGMYVWGEIPSAYEYGERMKEEFERDSLEIVSALSVHPSIISWVVFNESWGIPAIKSDRECQRFVEKMQQKFREKDPTRLIVINDGWHQLNGDLLTLHEYEQDANTLAREYRDKRYVVTDKLINENRYGRSFADNYAYSGQAVLISEFGGVSMKRGGGWGYGDGAENVQELQRRISALVSALRGLDYLAGFCYTQFTDVQQETNGLLTIDRKPKLRSECIRHIFAEENTGMEDNAV